LKITRFNVDTLTKNVEFGKQTSESDLFCSWSLSASALEAPAEQSLEALGKRCGEWRQ
jgi:hypothetical protein